MDWIDLAQDKDQWRALVNTRMNLRVPYNVRNFLSSCMIGGFSRRAHLQNVAVACVQICICSLHVYKLYARW
jgi:hypothetical protein